MAVPQIQASLTGGELAPALFGRTDLARYHIGASTYRNFFVNYRGGANSRAGTRFVGFSKQTGRGVPPRLIPFQFNISQGFALEFGNYYMRPIASGGFLTESPFQITNITQANPAVVSYQTLSTATAVTASNATVTTSYARGDTIVPAGGASTTPAQFIVVSTTLVSLALNAAGTDYAIGDNITLADGGGETGPPVLTVTGTGGGGAITTFVVSVGGSFQTNGTGNFTQASTTGSGTGATFNNGIFGPLVLAINNPGAYTAVPANPANQGSSSGTGLGATYTITWATPSALASGDWMYLAGVSGMTPVNGQTYVATNVTANMFQLSDVYGNSIDSTGFPAWTAGGTASRIYTLATPYAEADLSYIKFTQSADVMSLCCVNQVTGTEYPPLDLTRIANTKWTLNQVLPAPTVKPPPTASASASTSGSVDYQYVVTAVNPNDGTESIASPIASANSAVNIAATAGTITVSWTPSPTPNVLAYHVYKAFPSIGSVPPVGALFGFAGISYGLSFTDSNIVADMTQVPPLQENPFAPGQILGVNVTGAGAGASFTITINTLTGSGAVLAAIVQSNALVAVIVQQPGQNYLPTDTLTINNGATATLNVSPQTGMNPSVVAYFQERRAYAFSLNNPDTYRMSQPGAFTNFDFRIPTIDSDSITGSPWSVEVNGIQWMVPMPGGLVTLTGLSAWQLTGTGGSSLTPQPITPSTQQAQPQAYNGVSPTVPPIKIDWDIVYVQAKGSIYRNLSYQIYGNIYTGADMTVNSSHLFAGLTIKEHAWCEEPYKILWAVRSDGILLSMTYNKPEQVMGWARHDTDGTFQSVCAVTEPPVDALYVATQRFPGTNTAYMIERMDNRLWPAAEASWCVDCGLTLAQPAPAATLTASSPTGLGAVTGATGIVGGSGYSAGTTGIVVDAPIRPNGQPGPGTGAIATLTFVAGALTNVTFAPGNQGTGYLNPQLILSDPAGSSGGTGASVTLTLSNTMTFAASASVFALGNVGNVIRMGGGIAVITAYVDPQHVTANILSPITAVRTSATGFKTALPAQAGSWTMTVPVTTISGLNHLIGQRVTGLADGNVIPITTVPASGTINLPAATNPNVTGYTSVTVGIGFQAQLQSMPLDTGEPSVQGQRKKVAVVTVRMEASRGLKVGSNMPDGSTLSPMEIAPLWYEGNGGLVIVPDNGPNFPITPVNALATPLRTGDIRVPIGGGWQTPGQVAVSQDLPLPANILAFVNEQLPGDTPQVMAPKKEQRKAA